MTQHKVLSDDSMTAMDEIARVLGQDAVILSTKKIGEKIEIIGSNDIKDILKSNKKNQKKPNFKELFSKVPLSKSVSDFESNSYSKKKSSKEIEMAAQIFSTWKAEVNKICKEAFHGMSAASLVDYHWHDDFDANLEPWESVNEAVEFWTPDHPGIEEAWEQYIIKGIAYA